MTIPSLTLETSPTVEFFGILLAGSAASPEECQHLIEESDKQVKEILEGFGTRCIHSKVDIIPHHRITLSSLQIGFTLRLTRPQTSLLSVLNRSPVTDL